MKKQPISQLLVTAIVALITVAAFLLRVWGIKWGLPDAYHNFTYHPDEIFQIGAILKIDPFSMSLDPGFYNYPSGYMNLSSLVLRIAMTHGLAVNQSLVSVYLTSRLVVAALGALTVPIVFYAAGRLYGRAAGILSALIIAIVPLHVVHSHFATVDVPAAFWIAAAFLAAAVAITKPSFKWYVAAGISAGFAAGTKYNAAIVLIPVLVAHFSREDTDSISRRIRDLKLWSVLIAFIAGFIISTPDILIQPQKYLAGFTYELRHAGSGHGLVFQGKGSGWLDILVNALSPGLGIFLLAAVILAVVFAVVRRKRADWLILSFVIPYYAMVSLSEVRFARYMMLILPPLAMLTGRMMAEVYRIAGEKKAALKWVWAAMCVVIIGYTGTYAAAFDKLFLSPDPRTEAVEWFSDNVKPSATVGLPTVPWFYSPPISPDTTAMNRSDRFGGTLESQYKIFTNPDPNKEWDPSVIAKDQPEYIVMTDFEYEDARRLRKPQTMEFLTVLNRSYKEVDVFSKCFRVFGVSFGSTEQLPHDLKYMSPTIRIYRRK